MSRFYSLIAIGIDVYKTNDQTKLFLHRGDSSQLIALASHNTVWQQRHNKFLLSLMISSLAHIFLACFGYIE